MDVDFVKSIHSKVVHALSNHETSADILDALMQELHVRAVSSLRVGWCCNWVGKHVCVYLYWLLVQHTAKERPLVSAAAVA